MLCLAVSVSNKKSCCHPAWHQSTRKPFLYSGSKAYALIHGRNYVTPKDLQDLVPYVFSHRLIFYDRSLKEDEKKQIIHTLVAQIPIPVR
ncbi:TPA: hypothetical protein ACH6J7_002128 [Enterococcus faecium]